MKVSSKLVTQSVSQSVSQSWSERSLGCRRIQSELKINDLMAGLSVKAVQLSMLVRSLGLLGNKNQIKTSSGRCLLPCPADVTFFSSQVNNSHH